MRTYNKLLKLLAIAGLCAASAGAQNFTISGNVTLSGYLTINSVAFINCIFSPSYNCSQLANLFTSDPYSTVGGFTGYADSSLRADPNTGTVWTVYSKPAVQSPSGSLSVGNNLSHFDGTNWQYNTQIFASGQTIANGATSQTNFVSNEVPGLFLQNVGGTTYSYEAGLWYAVAPGGAGFNNQPSTNRFYVRGCSGPPTCLASATNQFLGWTDVDAVNFPFSQNLSTLAAGSGCKKFNEPSLYVSGTTLYMTAGCSDPYQYAIYEFSTPAPQSNLGAWTWSYVGKFITAAESNGVCAATFGALCGASNLISSCEMAASGVTGNPIMVCEQSTGGLIFGPIVFAMASLTPPAFTYTAGGLPAVLGYATCSPCGSTGPETGPGYEPTYPGGVVMTLQQMGCPSAPGCGTASGTFNQLVNTGLRP
jgi:hypothetical protein